MAGLEPAIFLASREAPPDHRVVETRTYELWQVFIQTPMETLAIPIRAAKIGAFCRHWRVQQLDVFCYVLREDFGPERDVDVLVAFAPDARPSLFDLVTMQDELETIIGHKVDPLERKVVEANHN